MILVKAIGFKYMWAVLPLRCGGRPQPITSALCVARFPGYEVDMMVVLFIF